MMYITNAFSLNMLSDNSRHEIIAQIITLEEARKMAANCVSAIGHADTAAVFSSVLGVPVQMNRSTLTLNGDDLLVGQYVGSRLPEGATELPEGATIKWLVVTVN